MDSHEIFAASRSFVLPSELTGPRPRDVQPNAAGRVVYGLMLLLFAMAIAAVAVLNRVSTNQAETRDAFSRDGVATRAEITRLWRDSDENKRYWVAYRFDANGAFFQGRSRIKSAAWRALKIGSAIDVLYLPAHPETNRLAGSVPAVLPAVVPFLVGAVFAVIAALGLRSLSCQRRLLMEGRAAPAVVTEIVKHQTSHGGTQRSIKYTFRLLSGAVAKGKSEAVRKPPAVGSVICVVYDPDRPRRSRRYPFPLFKTARL